jgi:hypothetical protein
MKTDLIKRWLVSWLQQCLLRRAPQDDPLSYSALQWSIVAYVLMDLLQARASSDWPASLGMTILDTLVMVLFAWTVLLLMKKSARLVQALTALAGTGTVLGIVGLPLMLQATRTQAEDADAGVEHCGAGTYFSPCPVDGLWHRSAGGRSAHGADCHPGGNTLPACGGVSDGKIMVATEFTEGTESIIRLGSL